MILRLHGPDVIAVVAEGFRRIFSYAGVDEERFVIYIDDKRTYIIMIVILTIVAALHGNVIHASAGCHYLKILEPDIF